MRACEHVFIAEIFEVVLLRLRTESAGVIGVPGREPRRRTHDHFVHTTHAPRPCQERPRIVAAVAVPVAITDSAAAAILGRREGGIRRSAPPNPANLEIRIYRQRFALGPSEIGVSR